MTFAHFSGRQRENEQNGMNAENSVLSKTTAEKRRERERERKKQYSIVNFGDVATYSGYSEYYKALHILKFRTTEVGFM